MTTAPGAIAAADEAGIARAARLLAQGRLVAFPTETVYGLGADARNVEAVRAIFAAKGRPADHPVIVHVADPGALASWVREVSDDARRLAQAFWPGPLTLILPRAPHVHDVVTGGQDTVGIRVPSHPVAQSLLRAFGGGVAAPSANRFGRISPTTAQHVTEDLGNRVDLVLDGGACPVGIESTIVACVGDTPMLLRPGGIGIEALTRVLGRAPAAAHRDAPRASGTLASHYAPRTPARLVDASELAKVLRERGDARVGVLARRVPRPLDFNGTWISAPEPAQVYAHDLYANLRALDHAGVANILIESVPDEAAWLAVRDRLARATHGAADDAIDDID